MKVIIFGTGQYYTNRKKDINLNQVVAFLDNNREKQGKKCDGVTILPPDVIQSMEYDYVVIMVKFEDEIRKQLIDLGVPYGKIIDYNKYLSLGKTKISERDFSKVHIDRILIFGTGLYMENRIDDQSFDNVYVDAFVDNDKLKHNTFLHGVKIVSPHNINQFNYDYIVIMTKYYDEVMEQLYEMGVQQEKIVSYEQWRLYKNRVKEKISGVEEVPFEGTKDPLVSILVTGADTTDISDTLEAIFQQTYDNFQVHICGEVSEGNKKLLDDYQKRVSSKLVTIDNFDKLTHTVQGDLVWTVKGGDYFDNFFLELMVKKFKIQSVMLAFSKQTIFFSNGIMEDNTTVNLDFDWENAIILPAHVFVNKYLCKRKIIPSISGVILRNSAYTLSCLSCYVETPSLENEWMLYLKMMRGGSVAYECICECYSKRGDKNIQHEIQEMMPSQIVKEYLVGNYKLHDSSLECLQDGNGIYDNYRKKNIGMCTWSLQSGGGEIYPIHLANELVKRGYGVTLFDFAYTEGNVGVRNMVDPRIPICRIAKKGELADYFEKYGIEVIHSHHADIDMQIAMCLKKCPSLEIEHIITLHGMYETCTSAYLTRLFKAVMDECSQFIYIADKNLDSFKKQGIYEQYTEKFVKLPNGLPSVEYKSEKRENYGITQDDFVLCIASRAIKAKGWIEAVNAVTKVNQLLEGKSVHLMMVGDGEMHEKFMIERAKNIHPVGYKSNVRDFFAMSDMGILPSTYQGESYPLVLVECLMVGKPVIATDIGEVRTILEDDNKEYAGEIIPIIDGQVDEDALVKAIYRCATDSEHYNQLCARVESACSKSKIENVVDQYAIYYDL